MLYYVGGLKELDQLNCRRTRGFRLDDCSASEVVQDLDTPAEKTQRVRRVMRIIRGKLRKSGGT